MKFPLFAAMTAVVVVSACGRLASSPINPFNWFGGGRPEATTLAPKGGFPEVVQDGRALVDQVVDMQVEPMPGGAIVRAIGLPPTQGWWDAALLIENDGVPVDGVISFFFVVAPPPTATAVSTQPSRELTVAAFLSEQALVEVRQITVRGVQNQISRRR